ncbi:MAG TPA: hypothetical protein VFC82_09295 [Actinomycetaceae bacterium]|nr:hypothetical protein [Actinomycetaceae bacterium]
MPQPVPRPRRPARLDEALAESIVGAPDPAERTELAHVTARALVERGRDRSGDPELLHRLVHLMEDEGIEVIADLWSLAAAQSLPGALWRLYVTREWARRNPHQVVRAYRAGLGAAEVSGAIAGVVEPPLPEDVMAVTDRILAGVFDGDLDVALDRASAFLKVTATGIAINSDGIDDPRRAHGQVRRASSLMRTANDLEGAARLAREGALE